MIAGKDRIEIKKELYKTLLLPTHLCNADASANSVTEGLSCSKLAGPFGRSFFSLLACSLLLPPALAEAFSPALSKCQHYFCKHGTP